MDYSPPGSSVHGIFQARILEWIAIPSGGSESKESVYSAGDPGSVPGSGRSLENGMATHSSIFAWRIPWTEKLTGYGPWGCKDLETTE